MLNEEQIDLENDRYGLFISNNSIDLDIMYGRNYLRQDNPQTIVLHRINIIETKAHPLYGQAKTKDKIFLPPIKLNVMVNIDESKQEYYGASQSGIVRDDTGNLTFGIYLKELEENDTEINRGDIVQYNMNGNNNRYYEVENANNVTDETKKSIGGFVSYWKKITAIPIKSDTFNFYDGKKGN